MFYSPEAIIKLVALNNAHAAELSWLDARQLGIFLNQAFCARSIGQAEAFLLAFDETAVYDSPNYLWFRERYPRFVYIDRVAVSPAARRRGHAQRLYADLGQQAAAERHSIICCEVNLDPPNPASDALHAALGFTEVGRAALHGRGKTVRYLTLPITPDRAEEPV